MTIEAPESAIQELLELGRTRQWGPYFRTLRELHRGPGEAEAVQPRAEHTMRDPWPGEVKAPLVINRLETLALSFGWEVRVGYSRGSKKLGRGNVGGTGTARWVRHHFVRLQIRDMRTGKSASVTYAANGEVEKLRWTPDNAWVMGKPANVTAFTAYLRER